MNLPKPSPRLKQLAGLAVLVITVVLFGRYIHGHPGLLNSIKIVSPVAVVGLLFLYALGLLTNAAILHWSVQICSRSINYFESLLLTSYSSLVNFFGPLQSGPGFRALYLKRKHNVSIKSYGMATLLYYGAFGVFSLLLVSYGLSAWLASIALVVVLVGSILGGVYLSHRNIAFIKHPLQASKIVIITAVQIAFTLLIYFVELRSVNRHISISQAFVYTGAANLALFVSLTPGAIGFRESFLLFSKRLHHISTHDILAASVIDRAVYFAFLGLLFAFTALFHVQDRLKKTRPAA